MMMLLIMMIEIFMMVVFLFYINSMVMLMVVMGVIAMLFVDGFFMIMAFMGWPVLMMVVIMVAMVINGIRVVSVNKIVYAGLMSMMTPILCYCYLLVLVFSGVVMVTILSAYISYWVISSQATILMLCMYFFIDSKLVWLGILPLIVFFMKQNIVMMLFMMKVIWFY